MLTKTLQRYLIFESNFGKMQGGQSVIKKQSDGCTFQDRVIIGKKTEYFEIIYLPNSNVIGHAGMPAKDGYGRRTSGAVSCGLAGFWEAWQTRRGAMPCQDSARTLTAHQPMLAGLWGALFWFWPYQSYYG